MIESRIQQEGSKHAIGNQKQAYYVSNCSYGTYKSIEHYIDQERAYKLALTNQNQHLKYARGDPYMQQFNDNELINPTMHHQCNQVYKTNENIFSSAWLKEIVQIFRIPARHHTRIKSQVYQNLFNDKLIIVMNSLPAISKLISLGSLMANPVTYLKI